MVTVMFMSLHCGYRTTAADVVFVNGLGFEGWIDRLVKASGYKGKLLLLQKELKN